MPRGRAIYCAEMFRSRRGVLSRRESHGENGDDRSNRNRHKQAGKHAVMNAE
jgi:hypothetical protein